MESWGRDWWRCTRVLAGAVVALAWLLIGPDTVSAAPMGAPVCDSQVYSGVTHCTDGDDTHVVVVDLSDSNVSIRLALPRSPSGAECNSVNHSGKDNDGNDKDRTSNCPGPPYPTEKVSAMLEQRIDRGAVAAINADYFGSTDGDHGPEGLAVRDGVRLDGPEHNVQNTVAVDRSALALSRSKDVRIGPPKRRDAIDTNGAYYNAVSGGPTIVRDGKAFSLDDCHRERAIENMKEDVCTRAVQSGAGVTADRKLVLVSARRDAAGIARYLVDAWHVRSALKLDGGGSTNIAWVTADRKVSKFDASGEDRAVAEVLVVYSSVIQPDRRPVPKPGPAPVPTGGSGGSWADRLLKPIYEQWDRLVAWADKTMDDLVDRATEAVVSLFEDLLQTALQALVDALARGVSEICPAGFMPPLVFVAVCWVGRRRQR